MTENYELSQGSTPTEQQERDAGASAPASKAAAPSASAPFRRAAPAIQNPEVAQAQGYLIALGYKQGEVDGKMKDVVVDGRRGPITNAAMAQFAKDQKMDPNSSLADFNKRMQQMLAQRPEAAASALRDAATSSPTPNPNTVALMQVLVNFLAPILNRFGIKIDGIMNPQTREGVQAGLRQGIETNPAERASAQRVLTERHGTPPGASPAQPAATTPASVAPAAASTASAGGTTPQTLAAQQEASMSLDPNLTAAQLAAREQQAAPAPATPASPAAASPAAVQPPSATTASPQGARPMTEATVQEQQQQARPMEGAIATPGGNGRLGDQRVLSAPRSADRPNGGAFTANAGVLSPGQVAQDIIAARTAGKDPGFPTSIYPNSRTVLATDPTGTVGYKFAISGNNLLPVGTYNLSDPRGSANWQREVTTAETRENQATQRMGQQAMQQERAAEAAARREEALARQQGRAAERDVNTVAGAMGRLGDRNPNNDAGALGQIIGVGVRNIFTGGPK